MLTVVTAANEKFWRSLRRFLRSIERRDNPARHRIIVWDLGLSPTTRATLSTAFPWCIFRSFDFASQPAHVGLAAGTYAWKPIIIADMAEEFGGLVLWLDSATVLKQPLDPMIEIMRRLGSVSLRGQSPLSAHCDPDVLDALKASADVRDLPERAAGVIGFDIGRPEVMKLVQTWRHLALDPQLARRSTATHKGDQALLSFLLHTAEAEDRLVLNVDEVDISSPHPMRWLTTRNKIPMEATDWTEPLWGLWHDTYKIVDQSLIALDRWHQRRLCGAHRWPKEHFSVFLQKDGDSTSTPFLAPWASYYADPFVWTRNDITCLFVEEFRYLENRGRLVAAKLDQDLAPGPFRPLLPLDIHASFPFLFEHGGHLFMLPETSAGRYIDLYECLEFPFEWRRIRRLFYGVDAADSVIFPHGGLWWLLTAERPDGEDGRHLALYHCDDPLTGAWHPHPVNREQRYRDRPFSGMRNAGTPWVEDGRLFRVAQANHRYYGDGVQIMEITRLDPERFEERAARDAMPNGRQIHHLCRHNALTAWDVRDRIGYIRTFTGRGRPAPVQGMEGLS